MGKGWGKDNVFAEKPETLFAIAPRKLDRHVVYPGLTVSHSTPRWRAKNDATFYRSSHDGHGCPQPPGIVPRPNNPHPCGLSHPLSYATRSAPSEPCLRLLARATSRRPTGAGGAASGPAASFARRGRGGGGEANYSAGWLGRDRASSPDALRLRRRSFGPRRPPRLPLPRLLRLLRLVFLLLARLLLPSASNLLLYRVVLASSRVRTLEFAGAPTCRRRRCLRGSTDHPRPDEVAPRGG